MGRSYLENRERLQQRIALLESRIATYEQAVEEAQRLRDNLRDTAAALQLREQALEAISQGIVLTDASHWERPVRYVNTSFTQITGLTIDQLLGRPLAFTADWAVTAEEAERLRQALAHCQPFLGEMQCVHPDGKVVWAELSLRVVPTAEPPQLLIGLLTDISTRKSLEVQLIQAQKMDTIGRLTGGIAHDFNNSLTVIMGYSELLNTGAPLTPEQAEAVTEIRKSADFAARLATQLLAFSRKQLPLSRVLNLNTILGDLDYMLDWLLGEDVTLVYDLRPDLHLIKADPSQIEQVILNLAVNARDAMPQGGRLILATANVDLKSGECVANLAPGSYVLLTVSDTGVGMDAATLARLFEPFFTTKPPGKGTGQGLALVHGIVQQSGGHIDVRSAPGQGTTFKVYLPAVEGTATPVQLPAPAIDRPFRGSETILLVEDDDGLRGLAQTVLTRNGYRVLAAATGEEALLWSAQHQGPVALLVTDVVMPRLNGRQLAERLAPLRPAMRVLYLSGYTDEAVQRHGLHPMEWPFLQKPFTPCVFLRTVREVLDGQWSCV